MIAPKPSFALLMVLAVLSAFPVSADAILFDATKHEMGGNADWVIDADAWNLSMMAYPCTGSTNESNPGRYPTPAQAGITPSTPNTYWTGGISSWAVELAKAGHTVESLPHGVPITFDSDCVDVANSQDLCYYDLFIVPEPQNPFTASEKTAILAFVNAGGGLFMVADHETSDRDCDGWDSPEVFNNLTGATGTTVTGLFGIWFRVDGLEVKGEDWFDDGIDNNVSTDSADPIIHGPFGDGSGGLGFFGATSMDINPAIATAHVWRTGQPHNELRVTFATATYGAGRVAAIGDSSPADDNSGDPGDTLYPGWDLASGGVNNKEIHLNACHWLLNPEPDTVPPVIESGPSVEAGDCTAVVTWTTDEPASSVVQYGQTDAYGLTASTPGYAASHSVVLPGLDEITTYHYRVGSTDGSGNGPTWSADRSFSTTAAVPPAITGGPAAGSITGNSATITWITDEAANSLVEYGLDDTYGSSASLAGYALTHAVPVTGLEPETTYHYRVGSVDACGNGPTYSADATFQTGPASMDISGWTLKQYNADLTYTFPVGTLVPSGGYVVVARNSARAAFEAFFAGLGHPMPAGTVFLNSNALGSCANGCIPQVNGGETFDLYNASGVLVDAPSVTMGENDAYQRNAPGGTAWTTVPEASANPGQGAGIPSGVGLVINELADASDYTKEFVELYYDAGASNPVLAAPTATPSPRCAGETTRLAANASGGTPPYTYLWSPATGLDSVTSASPGCSAAATTVYSVVVTDSLSASSAPAPVTVTVSAPGVSPAAVPAVILPGGTSQLSAGASGGIGSYAYAWAPTVGLSDSSIADPVAGPSATTLYSVIATDGLGCASPPQGVTVTVVPEVSGSAASQQFQLAKAAGGGLAFRFGWAGTGMNHHLYSAVSESAMDAGAWTAKWCDLANNPEGTWATDSATWASWTATGSIPDGFFVVVAESSGLEGSYGLNSDGDERTRDTDQVASGGFCLGMEPSCNIASPVSGVQSGNIVVIYDASDPNDPVVHVKFEYSLDGGAWTPAAPAFGSSNDIDVAVGTGKTFTWDSAADIPGSGPVGFRITINDPTAQSTCVSSFTVSNASSCVGHLVISQVYGGGGNSGATYRNDYIELYNCTDAAINLGGWSVQYTSATGDSWNNQLQPLTGSIPGHGYYLIQGASGGAVGATLPTPDVLGTINSSASAGKWALVSSITPLTGTCPLGQAGGEAIVDFLGYGTTADCREGGTTTAFNAPPGSNTAAVLRNYEGCADTDVNSADFAAGGPSPRNSSSSNTCP